MQPILWTDNHMPGSQDRHLSLMSLDNVEKAYRFHQSFPQYSVTPLANLTGMAGTLGLGALCVKDESYRFGLNAFKVLGGSFAMARYIAEQLHRDVSELTYDYLTSDKLRQELYAHLFIKDSDCRVLSHLRNAEQQFDLHAFCWQLPSHVLPNLENSLYFGQNSYRAVPG